MRELIAVVARGDVDYLADQLDDGHVIGIGFGGIPNLIDDELDRCVDEKYRQSHPRDDSHAERASLPLST